MKVEPFKKPTRSEGTMKGYWKESPRVTLNPGVQQHIVEELTERTSLIVDEHQDSPTTNVCVVITGTVIKHNGSPSVNYVNVNHIDTC